MRNFKEIIRIRNSKKGNGNIEVFRDLVLYSAFNIYIYSFLIRNYFEYLEEYSFL